MSLSSAASIFSSIATKLQGWAHASAPAGSAQFEALAWLSLAFYVAFAVVALHYALRPWAEKAMLASLLGATTISLILHLALQYSPTYQGAGPLWKFVSLSQYAPWPVLSAGCLYLLYRGITALTKRCRQP